MRINIFGRMHQRKYENETFPFSDISQTKELFLGTEMLHNLHSKREEKMS